jgi:hypothetical protein
LNVDGVNVGMRFDARCGFDHDVDVCRARGIEPRVSV